MFAISSAWRRLLMLILVMASCSALCACGGGSSASASPVIAPSPPVSSPAPSSGAPVGQSVLPPDPISTYGVYGADGFAVVPEAQAGLPFTQAFQIQRKTGTANSYDASIYWTTVRDVAKNDLLVATFWVKDLNADGSVLRLTPVFQDQTTYNQALISNAPSDQPGWVEYAIPFRANQIFSVSGDGAAFQISFGDAAQTFQVGGVNVVDYGAVPDPIPASISSQFAFYYPGRNDQNAAWRVTAQQDIISTRMANLSVLVTASGQPVQGASVTLNETRPAFLWGSALDSCALVGTCQSPADSSKYQQAVMKNFNAAAFENDLKWPQWECCKSTALQGVAWDRLNNLAIRGHNLIWPKFSTMPTDTLGMTSAQLTTAIDQHFTDEEGALQGELYEWDVVNEPYTSNQVQGLIPGVANVTPSTGVLGNAAIVSWYQLAAQADPLAHRYLNDYSVFVTKNTVHAAYDLALLQYMQVAGAGVQGFGFQSHFEQSGPVFSDMQATIHAFDPYISEYGVTEFDFATIDPALQADLTRDFMTFIFGQPKFHEFIMWGFWDGAQWKGNAPLYNLDWSLKPSGAVFQQLTQQTWQTHASGSTDASGQYQQLAYKGMYTVTASANGKTCSQSLDLTASSALTVSLDCQ